MAGELVACVADGTNPRYSPSANQRPKACSGPRVLPGFSIIASDWLLYIAVLSCAVNGRVETRGGPEQAVAGSQTDYTGG